MIKKIAKEYCCNKALIKHRILSVLYEHWRKKSLTSNDPNDNYLSSSKIATLTKLKCPYDIKVSCMRELTIGGFVKSSFPNDGTQYVTYRLEEKGEEAFLNRKFEIESESIRKNKFDKYQKIGVLILMVIGTIIAYLTLLK